MGKKFIVIFHIISLFFSLHQTDGRDIDVLVVSVDIIARANI